MKERFWKIRGINKECSGFPPCADAQEGEENKCFLIRILNPPSNRSLGGASGVFLLILIMLFLNFNVVNNLNHKYAEGEIHLQNVRGNSKGFTTNKDTEPCVQTLAERFLP